MKSYPSVLSEDDTLRLVLDGCSLARFGDGEFKICNGSSIKSQSYHPKLARRLREILTIDTGCLVGIPNIYSATPKASFWNPYTKYASFLADRPYASSFITRPDSAPWIDTPTYWALLESLWTDQAVTLVRGSSKSLIADDLAGSGATITEIVAPRQHAWADYDELLERIGRPTRALLCLGPTATVLAVDLHARGVHAIDLGHAGMFLRKRRRGEALAVTDADRIS